jgi:hypothetical protein
MNKTRCLWGSLRFGVGRSILTLPQDIVKGLSCCLSLELALMTATSVHNPDARSIDRTVGVGCQPQASVSFSISTPAIDRNRAQTVGRCSDGQKECSRTSARVTHCGLVRSYSVCLNRPGVGSGPWKARRTEFLFFRHLAEKEPPVVQFHTEIVYNQPRVPSGPGRTGGRILYYSVTWQKRTPTVSMSYRKRQKSA